MLQIMATAQYPQGESAGENTTATRQVNLFCSPELFVFASSACFAVLTGQLRLAPTRSSDRAGAFLRLLKLRGRSLAVVSVFKPASNAPAMLPGDGPVSKLSSNPRLSPAALPRTGPGETRVRPRLPR